MNQQVPKNHWPHIEAAFHHACENIEKVVENATILRKRYLHYLQCYHPIFYNLDYKVYKFKIKQMNYLGLTIESDHNLIYSCNVPKGTATEAAIEMIPGFLKKLHFTEAQSAR